MDEDLNLRLARLLEPEPTPDASTMTYLYDLSSGGAWQLGWRRGGKEWAPRWYLWKDLDCFAAVDEMVRRGYRYSFIYVWPGPDVEKTCLATFYFPAAKSGEIDLRFAGFGNDRREALVCAMIAALEEEK